MDKVLKCPNCGLIVKEDGNKATRCIRCNAALLVFKPCEGNCKACGEQSDCNKK